MFARLIFRLPSPATMGAVLLFAAACGDKEESTDTTFTNGTTDTDTTEPDCDLSVDADCDGVPDADDCDPNDPLTYPGATEIPYDGADNDCAGDGDLNDVDGDGYISDRAGGDDCNDGSATAYPGAPEQCNGRDDDCDGFPTAPEDETSDCDGDGYGPGPGGDCDDENADVYPGAVEVWYDGVDGDCNGESDFDQDGDGDLDLASGRGGDCNDTDPTVYDGAKELIDGQDNDCDEASDVLNIRDASATFYGTTASGDGWLGMSAAFMDDYDGDGLVDWVVGGPWSNLTDPDCDITAGAVATCGGWVQVMPSSAPSTDPPGTVAMGRIEGDQSWLGWKISNIGDVDGDAYAELLVGAPLATANGGAFLFSGADLRRGGTLSESDALAMFSGSAYLGLDVGMLMDIDGDGVQEIFAGAGFNDQAIGTIPTWLAVWDGAAAGAGGNFNLGNAAWVLQGTLTGGETTGRADIDGDGVGDLVVGNDTARDGSVVFVSGLDIAVGGIQTPNDHTAIVGETGEAFGVHISLLGDANGDGYADIAASGPAATGAAVVAEGGIVRVLSGAALSTASRAADIALFTVEGSLDYGGLAVTGGRSGDIDGSGAHDLVVSYLGGSSIGIVRGRSHIFYDDEIAVGGTVVAEDAQTTLTASDSGDRFGFDGDLFDIDGDGDADLITGAPNGSSSRGIAVLYSPNW